MVYYTPDQLHILERSWMELLLNYVRNTFSHIALPSHNHWHHFRVWQNAKAIFFQLEQKGIVFEDQALINLMIAAFFHDTGLTITLDEFHGKAGADICRDFLKSIQKDNIKVFAAALEAIEQHDNKQYETTVSIENNATILSILSAADDMDAFGFVGVIRYAEIYLLRDIPMHDIPGQVIANAERRFENFREKFRSFELFVQEQSARYHALKNFFVTIQQCPSPIRNENLKILEHICHNIENDRNNHSLSALLEPINSEYIQQFRNEILQGERLK